MSEKLSKDLKQRGFKFVRTGDRLRIRASRRHGQRPHGRLLSPQGGADARALSPGRDRARPRDRAARRLSGGVPVCQKTSIGMPPRGYQKPAIRRYLGLIAATTRLPMSTVQSSWKAAMLRKLARNSFSDLDSSSLRRRHIVDDEMREIGLTGDRTERGEFGRREAHDVIRIRVRIGHRVEHRFIGRRRNRNGAAELQTRLARAISVPRRRRIGRRKDATGARGRLPADAASPRDRRSARDFRASAHRSR